MGTSINRYAPDRFEPPDASRRETRPRLGGHAEMSPGYRHTSYTHTRQIRTTRPIARNGTRTPRTPLNLAQLGLSQGI